MLNLDYQNRKLKKHFCLKAFPTAGERLDRIVREAVTNTDITGNIDITGNTGNTGNTANTANTGNTGNTGITGKPDHPSSFPNKLEHSPSGPNKLDHRLPPAENDLQINHVDPGSWHSSYTPPMPTLQRIVPLAQPVGSQFTSSPVYDDKAELADRLLLHQQHCHLQMPTPSWAPLGERRLWTCPLPAPAQDYSRANAQMFQECRANAGPLPIAHCPLVPYGRANTDIELRCQQATTMISQEESVRMDHQLHSCEVFHQVEAAFNKLRPGPACLAPPQQNTNDELFRQQEHTRAEVFTI